MDICFRSLVNAALNEDAGGVGTVGSAFFGSGNTSVSSQFSNPSIYNTNGDNRNVMGSQPKKTKLIKRPKIELVGSNPKRLKKNKVKKGS